MSAILGNAVLLGLETYSGFAERWHAQLHFLEGGFLAVFTAEVVLRILAHADRPRFFFRNPWNVFDAAVVLCAFLPVLGDNTTLLRLLRLLRVLRTARFLPQLRVIVTALGKSAPGTISFLVVGTLLLYVYAMVGWLCFATADPAHYGSIGRAALTLFILMTLDGLGEAVRAGLDISPWSFAYYASYVLLSSFLLVNLLIGVVINSLDQARDSELERGSQGECGREPDRDLAPDAADIQDRITAARRALDDAERLVLESLPRQKARDAPTNR
ncbi:ion transporter [Streptomyces kanamyceticus]|uniref:Ion transporter n=2 Tax=Streptomyces kanamyceticus TaxID=1967 RepID=A0A5J6GSP2_STRKN|nr:ion transporter [Streptomyces kanamyceticus]QEU97015.1 ion transporter [Streptomyces kanamyceticus]